MTRRIPGLRQLASSTEDVPDGFFLVRVERLYYRWERRQPHFLIDLTVRAGWLCRAQAFWPARVHQSHTLEA
jgi:hypothetical protein